MKAVLRRELDRIVHRPLEPLLLVVLPALALALTYAIFSARLPRDLPVAVVDEDHSRLSRQLVRMIDATPTIRVSERPESSRPALRHAEGFSKVFDDDMLFGHGGREA